jgi:hypothetical protein
LVYYPPYHSKSNPIERCWSALEPKWNGVLLNSLKVVLRCALRMTWKRCHPTVKRLHGTYPDGVRIPAKEMKGIEARLQRSATLPKYDITIKPQATEPVRWTPNTGQFGRPVFVMILPRSAAQGHRLDRPPRGSDNRVPGGGDPRRRTGSRPSGPTPVLEPVHNL